VSLPVIPVVQGRLPRDYARCVALYARHGGTSPGRRWSGWVRYVGVSDADIAELVTRLAARGYRLHGFGVSIKGLRRIGHLLASSDSQAWSSTARTERILLPGCQHWSKPDATGARHLTDCRNCFRHAMRYREEVMGALRQAAARADREHNHLPFTMPAPPQVRRIRPDLGRRGATSRRAPNPDQLALFDSMTPPRSTAAGDRAVFTSGRARGGRADGADMSMRRNALAPRTHPQIDGARHPSLRHDPAPDVAWETTVHSRRQRPGSLRPRRPGHLRRVPNHSDHPGGITGDPDELIGVDDFAALKGVKRDTFKRYVEDSLNAWQRGEDGYLPQPKDAEPARHGNTYRWRRATAAAWTFPATRRTGGRKPGQRPQPADLRQLLEAAGTGPRPTVRELAAALTEMLGTEVSSQTVRRLLRRVDDE